jgi:LAO/AO transport system kinase
LSSSKREGIEEIASRVRSGDRRALSRALSLIEDQADRGRALLDLLYSPERHAHRVGITGPPGSGKSTLVNELTRRIRRRGERVGILAVDPSSPFTGGAILGDRIRMQGHSGDSDVFIRSMASRGSLGGLASTTDEATELLDAAGFEWILIETVGVGQSEMEVVESADTTVIVLVPESGDAVQVMKAGLMEGGDVFVINKYDREGGDQLHRELSLMLEMARDRVLERGGDGNAKEWPRSVCRTVASRGDGVEELMTQILSHRQHLRGDPSRLASRQTGHITRRLRTQLRDRLLHALMQAGQLEEWIQSSHRKVQTGEASPYALVDSLVRRLLRGDGSDQSAANREGAG